MGSQRFTVTMSACLRPALNFLTKTGRETNLEDLKGVLSDFQLTKLTYFFYQFFDNNHDGVIDASDFEGLNERLRKVAGWDQEYLAMVDNNRVFLECLLDQAMAEKDTEGLENRTWEEAMAPSKLVMDSVSLASWLHMWARLSKGSHGIDDFPIWVQLIPRMIFNIICSKSGEQVISRDSLKHFYRNFYGLDYKSYKLLFSNFLLGRTIYGPGKYIFGCFDNRDMNEPYKIVYDM